MRRIILSLTATAAFILCGNAQQAMAEELLSLEQQAFACTTDSARNVLYIRKADCYTRSGEISPAALSEMQRVDPSLISDTAGRIRFFWNAAMMAHLLHDFNSAKNYFSRCLELCNDTTVSDAVFGALLYNEYDTAAVTRWINYAARTDSNLRCLDCLNEVYSYQRRGRPWIVFASYLVPGSGSMINGNVLRGVVSLALCAATGGGTFLLAWHGLYFNALFTTFPWFAKFYGGQVRLTKKLFDEKQLKRKNKLAKKCGDELLKVLDKYPLDFR